MRTATMTLMAVAAGLLLAQPAAAQQEPEDVVQPPTLVEGDTVIVRGCVELAASHAARPRALLAWAPGDLVFDGRVVRSAQPPATAEGEPTPFVYWLSGREDLLRYVGERVEITGTVAGRQEGRIAVSESGPVTFVHLRIDDRDEVARVPTAWLGPSAADAEDDDALYSVVVREIDIDVVDRLGECVEPSA